MTHTVAHTERRHSAPVTCLGCGTSGPAQRAARQRLPRARQDCSTSAPTVCREVVVAVWRQGSSGQGVSEVLGVKEIRGHHCAAGAYILGTEGRPVNLVARQAAHMQGGVSD